MDTLRSILAEFEIKGNFSISQVNKFTERCFAKQTYLDEYEDDTSTEQSTREDAFKLVRQVISNPSNGTPDHYHNYAITFVRASEFDLACEVLLCGIKRYRANTDLLSDYLEFAIKSSNDEHYEKCEEIFGLLQARRPQFWNWRAYDFSIDYLLDKIDRGLGEATEIKKQCLELAKEFQKRIPTSELGYIAEANVYSTFGENNKELAILKKVLNRDDLHAVQAATTLTEIYIKQNNPLEALKCVSRIFNDLPDLNARTTPSHVYVLSIICKSALLLSGMQPTMDTEQTIDRKLAQDILGEWKKLRKFNTRNLQYFETARTLVKFVEVFSNIKIDDDDEL